MNYDLGQVYSTSNQSTAPSHSPAHLESLLLSFLRDFRLTFSFPYRSLLQSNLLSSTPTLPISLSHLSSYSPQLMTLLQHQPTLILPLFENAAKSLASGFMPNPPDIHVTLYSDSPPTTLRDLTSDNVHKLVVLEGIIISASTLSAKATHVTLLCRSCGHVMQQSVHSGFGGIQYPITCQAPRTAANECGRDPYLLNHDFCSFMDMQTLKLQERPESVPVGELPRHVLLSAGRTLAGRVVPGRRVKLTGIYSLYQNKGNMSLQTPYVRVIGWQQEEADEERLSEEQEELCIRLAERDDWLDVFCKSIAPSIYGNMDMKRAIACLLMGGSRKKLPDGVRLRGDINVLLLGDPGTAKSQFLKFVEKVAPVAVYTSGKGSSAAGLTASVIRDPSTREFYLEGGAMVLADGGVVCIDEFDKMREEDRVAIHEAMEQQTISIAKAGITTVLNSRTSVLAAANPVFGRYDDMKSPGENIDFATTILSRFDMIFIVRDEHDEKRDRTVASHVMDVHMNRASATAASDLSLVQMKLFIKYARQKCAPKLSEAAATLLSNHYVSLRSSLHTLEKQAAVRSSIPITVRQLEAIIRISESIAKLSLQTVVTPTHVQEALRLFRVSTMDAIQSGSVEGMSRAEVVEEVMGVEKAVLKRLGVGMRVTVRRLEEWLVGMGYSGWSVGRALGVLSRREVVVFSHQRMVVTRVR